MGAKLALATCLLRCAFVQVPCTFFGFGVANAVCYLAHALGCLLVFGGVIETLLRLRDACKAACDRARKICDPSWTPPYVI